MNDPAQSFRGTLIAICVLLVGTIILTAPITPLVYAALTQSFGDSPWPFSRVFDRVAMFVALVLLVLLRKRFSFRDLRFYMLPGSWPGRLLDVVLGTLITIAVSFLAVEVVMWQGLVSPAPRTLGFLLWKSTTIFAAILISVIEEGFFRVMLFGAMKRVSQAWVAAVVTSAVYAVVHFITPAKKFVMTDSSPIEGFRYLGAVGGRFADPGVASALLGLFLVGMVLAFTIHRTRSFYLCVGLHAGWVFAMKLIGFMTIPGAELSELHGAGRRYVLVGLPIGWISILSVLLIIWVISRNRRWVRAGTPCDPNQPILFASTNPGKQEEAKAIAARFGAWLVVPSELMAKLGDPPNVVEDGATYYENAKKKALGFQSWSSRDVVADDSGIEVVHLKGQPGIHTARYGGAEGGVSRMLRETQTASNREAKYRAVLVFRSSTSDELVSEAELKGELSPEARGSGGFGFDPIFLPAEFTAKGEKRTLAELKAAGVPVKTHRVKAFEELFRQLGFRAN